MTLTKIDDINPFFKRVENKWIFLGSKLEIYIPKIYQERGLLTLGDTATTLAIFQLRINDTFFANMIILAKITIEFIDYHIATEGEEKYIVLELKKDSAFITNCLLVKDSNIIYEIFTTFLALGKIPSFIEYDNIQKLFDNDNAHCGVNLNVNHSIFEMIYAYIYRDTKDPYTFYRHTRMVDPPKIVPLQQISHLASSSSAKIIGSYLSEGIISALVDDSVKTPSLIENLLRS